jgi:hypothetical protein
MLLVSIIHQLSLPKSEHSEIFRKATFHILLTEKITFLK